MANSFPAINLVSGPRNISTALMYSFAQRADLQVVDEPFYACYLLQSGKVHPGQSEVLASQPNKVEDVMADLDELKSKNGLFIKNMAHHMEFIPETWNKDYRQLFLIRNPADLIASFARVIPQPDMHDIGLAMEGELFDFFAKTVMPPVVVLDSGELLKNPPKVLKELCHQLDIPWDERMLHWEPGPRKEDGIWAKYWYNNVHQSSGFSKQRKVARKVPENCKALYEEALPIYERLFENSIKA